MRAVNVMYVIIGWISDLKIAAIIAETFWAIIAESEELATLFKNLGKYVHVE